MSTELPRTIRFWGASAIMVGIIIGSGIFQTPVGIAGHLGSPLLILGFWLLGGVLSLFGALTYAEMATMYPESGGVYVFLREGYGRCMAFVFGWTYLLITKPFAAGGIAYVFATHLNPLLGVHWSETKVTIVVLTALTVLNLGGLRVGSGVAGLLTAIKVGALVAIALLGVVLLKGNSANLVAGPSPDTLILAIAPVMSAVLWTYDGWSDVGSIAGEVKDPQKELPRIYLIGTAAVTVLYLAVNAVYMWIVPLDEMRNVDNIGPVVARVLLGEPGLAIVSVIVLISTLGSTHGSIITGARVSYAQSKDGLLFRGLSHVHPTLKSPDVSLIVQWALSIAAVIYSGWDQDTKKTFATLSETFVFTMWIFYGLAGAAIFILRVRRPEVPRPYRCWGYPVVPALFVLAAAAMTGLSLYADWGVSHCWITGRWLLVLAAGVPVYFVWQALIGRAGPEGQPPPVTG